MKRLVLLTLAAVAVAVPALAAPPAQTPQLAATLTVTRTATPAPATEIAVVAADRLNVRRGPGTSFGVLGVATRGNRFEIVGRSDGGAWLNICCLNGQAGWVSAQFVTIEAGAVTPTRTATPTRRVTPTRTPTPGGIPIAVVNTNTLNVRSGPGTHYDIMGAVNRGSRLSIVGRNSDRSWWVVCCISSQQGWVSASLVVVEGSTGTVPIVPAPPTPTPRPATATPRPLFVQPQPQPAPSGNCDPSYPDVCIPPYPPDLNCDDVPYDDFRVVGPDRHRFDGDKDGIGCES